MEKTALEEAATLACPKRMEYGPCGGVEFDGRCEVGEHRCSFVDVATVRWRGAAAAAGAGPERAGTAGTPTATAAAAGPSPGPSGSRGSAARALSTVRPLVVADLPARALSERSIVETAGILGGTVDAVLAGDSGAERVQFPPAFRAGLLRAEGLDVWTGLNCRDRNRVALEGELAALAAAGVVGVHCVTGDHTLTGSRPDAAPVFDLDSTRLAALARSTLAAGGSGALVSVAESPSAPPVANRPARLVEKLRAGAEVCFVNHAGGAAPVAAFIASVADELGRQELARPPLYLPCVPVVVDHDSARLLESFTTLVLPDGFLARILGARDPFAEGVAASTELAREMLAIPGVSGVDLSGGPGPLPGAELRFAGAQARIAEALR